MKGLWILCCLTSLVAHLSNEFESSCSSSHHHNAAVSRASFRAREMLLAQPSDVDVKDRLLIMILFTKRKGRMELLRCSLLKLKANMMTNTTVDVFIWTLNKTNYSATAVPSWFTTTEFPRMQWMPIEQEVWTVPCGLSPSSQWALRQHFDVDYYLMGRWRLTFSLDFAKAMGFSYHLQFDDDAMLNSALAYNVVDKLKERNYLMGVFSDLIGEVPQATLGLPELTRYWLTITQFKPKGPLLKNLRPPSLDGLTSEGWNRLYHPGYFILFKVDLWFQSDVQDYLTTVFRSGRDIEGRWQEQAVMNMIRLLFVPWKQLWVPADLDLGHDRHSRGNFEKWCVASGVLASASNRLDRE